MPGHVSRWMGRSGGIILVVMGWGTGLIEENRLAAVFAEERGGWPIIGRAGGDGYNEVIHVLWLNHRRWDGVDVLKPAASSRMTYFGIELMDEMTDATETPTLIDESTETAAANKGLPKRLRGTREAQDPVPPSAAGRTQPARVESALEHAKIAARISSDNRGKNILLLDLRQATPLVDFFVIASAASRRQATSIAYDIDAEMKKLGEEKLGMEGADEGRWTLIDYGDFVVHVFSEEARAYYDLEEIWGDAPRVEWQDPSRVRPSAE